jgi:hypothetical protein
MNTQENQTPSAEEIAVVVAEVLRNMSQRASLQTPTTETIRPEIINFQDIAQKNKQPEPSSPQGASVPTTAAAVVLTTSQTPSNTAPAAKNEGDSAVPLQSEQKAQSGPQTEEVQSSASTMTRPVFDEDKILPVFRKELGEIFNLGTRLDQIEKEHQGKVQDKAIKALAKILGVRRKYFDGITPEVDKVLFEDLYQQCKNHGLKGRTKRTTEFHLLSRLYRQSDRKQASADAKILIRAHNEGQTAATLDEWVKRLGGLNSILKGITDYERDKKKQEDGSKRKRQALKGNLKALYEATKIVSWTNKWSLEYKKVPETLSDLLPSDAGTWSLVLVENNGEKFRLYSPQKDSAFCELLGRDPKFSADETPSDNNNNSDSSTSANNTPDSGQETATS